MFLCFRCHREGKEAVAAPELAPPTFCPQVSQCSSSGTKGAATQVSIPDRCKSKQVQPFTGETSTKKTKHSLDGSERKALRLLLDLFESFTAHRRRNQFCKYADGWAARRQMQRQRARVTIEELRLGLLHSERYQDLLFLK